MELSLLKHCLISTFGTGSLPLQKGVTNADGMGRKKMQKDRRFVWKEYLPPLVLFFWVFSENPIIFFSKRN